MLPTERKGMISVSTLGLYEHVSCYMIMLLLFVINVCIVPTFNKLSAATVLTCIIA